MSAERPAVLLETRQPDIAGTRQDAIGEGLDAAGIRPIYADVGNPGSFTPDGSAVRDFRVRDPDHPGRLVEPTDRREVIVPAAYRFRDVPTGYRPAFSTEIPGYNNGQLCNEALGRISMRYTLTKLGFAHHMPPSRITEATGVQLDLRDMEGDMLFVKPGGDGAYSDVGGDVADRARRAHYVHRNEVASLLSSPQFSGRVLLQPDITASTDWVIERLDLRPEGIADYEHRTHHTLRIYHMIGANEVPDVAEVRLMTPDDIGRPEPSYYELLEPQQVFAAFSEVEELQYMLSRQLGEKYGLNYIAADYFLNTQGKAMIDGVHVRPWLPSIKDDSLSRRTVETEVRTLSRLALQE